MSRQRSARPRGLDRQDCGRRTKARREPPPRSAGTACIVPSNLSPRRHSPSRHRPDGNILRRIDKGHGRARKLARSALRRDRTQVPPHRHVLGASGLKNCGGRRKCPQHHSLSAAVTDCCHACSARALLAEPTFDWGNAGTYRGGIVCGRASDCGRWDTRHSRWPCVVASHGGDAVVAQDLLRQRWRGDPKYRAVVLGRRWLRYARQRTAHAHPGDDDADRVVHHGARSPLAAPLAFLSGHPACTLTCRALALRALTSRRGAVFRNGRDGVPCGAGRRARHEAARLSRHVSVGRHSWISARHGTAGTCREAALGRAAIMFAKVLVRMDLWLHRLSRTHFLEARHLHGAGDVSGAGHGGGTAGPGL